ncbi:hypothetical protein AB0C84_14450 [Actinomadura sp. NPDC048955]|uniref:hypothetical protein n=1 Tax=Actinomadura sp. NPDC048955 TaxID=3158228 RepID=UPI0033D11C2C
MSGIVFGISNVERFDDPDNPTVFGIEIDASGRSRVSTGDRDGRTGSDAARRTTDTTVVEEQP